MEQKLRRFYFTQYKMDYDWKRLGKYTYLIVGDETCPKTGRKHYQGYVEYKSGHTVTSMRKKLYDAHCNPAKGTGEQNRVYCSKEKVILEEGKMGPGQGARTDLEGLVLTIQEDPGLSDRDLIELAPATWARNYRALEIVKSIYEPKRDWVTEVIYLWGPSGCGKTRRAIEDGAVPITYQNRFFAGYGGEDVVLIDDVDETTWEGSRQTLLQLLDRYPYNINIKGGSRNWKPRKLYMTSNFPPHEVFGFGPTGVIDPAIKRRITEVVEMEHT